jgi:arylamine N-acetyltransferase
MSARHLLQLNRNKRIELDIATYLKRIDYRGALEPMAETLRALHLAHMLAAPLENLDYHLGRWMTLDNSHLFAKIVSGRRGGVCYELNGLFAAMLAELGFKVEMLAAMLILPRCAIFSKPRLSRLIRRGAYARSPLRTGELRCSICG